MSCYTSHLSQQINTCGQIFPKSIEIHVVLAKYLADYL